MFPAGIDTYVNDLPYTMFDPGTLDGFKGAVNCRFLPGVVFHLSVTKLLWGLGKQFINYFVFSTSACASGFNFNNLFPSNFNISSIRTLEILYLLLIALFIHRLKLQCLDPSRSFEFLALVVRSRIDRWVNFQQNPIPTTVWRHQRLLTVNLDIWGFSDKCMSKRYLKLTCYFNKLLTLSLLK